MVIRLNWNRHFFQLRGRKQCVTSVCSGQVHDSILVTVRSPYGTSIPLPLSDRILYIYSTNILTEFCKTCCTISILTCMCLTAGVLVLMCYRQIRDDITAGITLLLVIYTHVWAQNAERGGGGIDHTSVAPLTNQLCSDRGVVRVFEYSINVLYYKYGRNQFDAIRKQKNAEYCKRYRLKRKLNKTSIVSVLW